MTRWSYPSSGLFVRVSFCLVLLMCPLAWSQVDTAESTAPNTYADDVPARVPPPVSGQAYPATFADETESNHISYGLTLGSGYSSNVTGGNPALGSMNYSIWPTIGLNRITYRSQLAVNYSPGFTFYQRVSGLNQGSQNLSLNFQYRLTPRLTASLQEAFTKTSNILNQSNPLNVTTVSGSAPVPSPAIITPIMNQISDTTTVQLNYQVSANGILGGSGTYSTLRYPDSSTTSELFNSQFASGSFFYSQQLSERYTVGGTYQYQNILSYQAAGLGTRTETQSVFGFLTLYLKPTLSVSLSAGPQHYSSTQAPLPTSAAWQPMTMASVSWRGERTTIAASYSRAVSGGGGLNGTFHSNSASWSVRWQASRNWTVGASGAYTNNQSLTPLFLSSPGGHTISATASLQRTLTDHMNLQFGYSYAHQTYSDIPAISNIPNTNWVFMNLSFRGDRPLHR